MHRLQIESDDLSVHGRVEAFSCKMVKTDKKLLGECAVSMLYILFTIRMESRSPNPAVLSVSPMGTYMEQTTVKTLSYLVSTLNLSFPDYDFVNAQGQDFRLIPFEMTKSTVNQTLLEVLSNADKNKEETGHQLSLDEMWAIIDRQVSIQDCEIFEYNPKPDADPFQEEGYLWSFNYFFYNRRFSQIVFLTCSAVSNIHSPSGGMMDAVLDGEEFDLTGNGIFSQEDAMSDI